MAAVLLLVFSGALPFRIWHSVGPFRSFSILDIAIVCIGVYLAARALRGRHISIGEPWLFLWICVVPAIGGLSLLWTSSVEATLRDLAVNIEALTAYVCICTGLAGHKNSAAMKVAALMVFLLLLGCVLMFLRVPGFEPQGIQDTNIATLASYYARLSHPFLGPSNNLAGLLAYFVFPFSLWAWHKRSLPYAILAFVTAVALLLTLSRGAILAVILTAGIAALQSRAAFRRFFTLNFVLAPMLVAAGFFIVSSIPIASQYIADRLSLSNVLSRDEILQAAATDLNLHPLLGYGAGAIFEVDERLELGAHDTYVQQMLAYGVPLGTVCGLAFVMIVARLRSLCLRPDAPNWRRALWLASLCELFVFATETSFEGSILRILFYVLIGWTTTVLIGPDNAVENCGVGGITSAGGVMNG